MSDTTAEKPKVILHWLNTSRAQSFVWLLEECKGIESDIKIYKRGKDHLAPDELKKIHPLGKSPVVSIQSSTMAEPLVMAESGAIVEYLSEHFAPHLIPTKWQDGKDGQVGGETEQFLRYRYYLHYAEGSLMSLLLIALFMDQIKNAQVSFLIKPIVRQIPAGIEKMYLNRNFETHFGWLESQLKSSPDGGKFLCGKDITAADILMSFPLIVANKSKIDKSKFPRLDEYIKSLQQSEGYQRSIKRMEDLSGESFKAML